MREGSEQSPQFHAVQGDHELVEFSRSSFRVRVAGRSGFHLRYGSLCVPLADISIGGVSLILGQETAIAPGDIICNCELSAGNTRFSGLSGRVVHRSLNAQGHTVTGIQWLDLNPITVKRLQVALAELRKLALESSDTTH